MPVMNWFPILRCKSPVYVLILRRYPIYLTNTLLVSTEANKDRGFCPPSFFGVITIEFYSVLCQYGWGNDYRD